MHKGWKLHSYDSLQLSRKRLTFIAVLLEICLGYFPNTPAKPSSISILPLNSSQKVVHRQPARPEGQSFFQRRLPKPLCRVELQYNLSPDAQRPPVAQAFSTLVAGLKRNIRGLKN